MNETKRRPDRLAGIIGIVCDVLAWAINFRSLWAFFLLTGAAIVLGIVSRRMTRGIYKEGLEEGGGNSVEIKKTLRRKMIFGTTSLIMGSIAWLVSLLVFFILIFVLWLASQ